MNLLRNWMHARWTIAYSIPTTNDHSVCHLDHNYWELWLSWELQNTHISRVCRKRFPARANCRHRIMHDFIESALFMLPGNSSSWTWRFYLYKKVRIPQTQPREQRIPLTRKHRIQKYHLPSPHHIQQPSKWSHIPSWFPINLALCCKYSLLFLSRAINN
jgi:hypothetical protein